MDGNRPKTTGHGAKRVRERVKVPKRAAERMAKLAYERGKKREQYSGSMRRYLDKVYWKTRDHGKFADIVLYDYNVYIFATNGVLITTWPLPAVFRKKA